MERGRSALLPCWKRGRRSRREWSEREEEGKGGREEILARQIARCERGSIYILMYMCMSEYVRASYTTYLGIL